MSPQPHAARAACNTHWPYTAATRHTRAQTEAAAAMREHMLAMQAVSSGGWPRYLHAGCATTLAAGCHPSWSPLRCLCGDAAQPDQQHTTHRCTWLNMLATSSTNQRGNTTAMNTTCLPAPICTTPIPVCYSKLQRWQVSSAPSMHWVSSVVKMQLHSITHHDVMFLLPRPLCQHNTPCVCCVGCVCCS